MLATRHRCGHLLLSRWAGWQELYLSSTSLQFVRQCARAIHQLVACLHQRARVLLQGGCTLGQLPTTLLSCCEIARHLCCTSLEPLATSPHRVVPRKGSGGLWGELLHASIECCHTILECLLLSGKRFSESIEVGQQALRLLSNGFSLL